MVGRAYEQGLFDDKPAGQASGPVECLGKTFEDEAARREYFLEQLREKLRDPDFRNTDGFPIGSDDDILALSDPPYYTACPNPFVGEFVELTSGLDESVSYSREPYTGELRSSNRHPVYAFHPYHTKVPPEVIRTLIEHYTEPGDLVLDGFCGSGMTGVAAREVGRNAVVSDLCTIAGFIAGANCTSHDWREAIASLQEIIAASEDNWGHLYVTEENGMKLAVNYYVSSDVFTCPECVYEFPFFPYGVIHHGNKVETRKSFPCPSCGAALNVRRVERVLLYEGKKKALAWVNAGSGRFRINRAPNNYDSELARHAESSTPESWFPTDPIDPNGYSAKLAQLGDKAITDVSRFLSRRNLIIFADMWARVSGIPNASVRHLCRSTLTSIFTVISERQGYFGGGGGMSGNLYMPIVRMEKNVYQTLRRKLKKLEEAETAKEELGSEVLVSTQSTTDLSAVPDATVDYIYTDPPFGANIIYSEMNLILESWLRVKTNDEPEAVIDVTRRRDFNDYAALMRACFDEYFRVLKPGRWITVEFHNTMASVWNLIQNTIGESGFVVAQVGVFDKGSTTILADIRPGAAKYDLIISAYKPGEELERRFELEAGTEEGAWDFVSSHLRQLPVFVPKDGAAEVVAERTNHLLYDRMVAFHVQRGVAVPLSAAEFYADLQQRYPERDGMYFTPDQVAEYDRRRMSVRELMELQLFVTDEKSAVQWLEQHLTRKPQTFQEVHPQFMKELGGWQKHEKRLELAELLEQNFLRYDGTGEVPSQIHGYLSSNFKALRNLPKEHSELRLKAKDRWYVPDPNKANDLEKLREQALLKEFREYKHASQKLGVVRLEAVRAGFKKAWGERDYETILEVARKIPEPALQEDEQLLMWYDQALTRTGADWG